MLIIDSFAYASRFRPVHPAKKAVFSISLLIACISLQSIAFGLLLAAAMGALSVWGGGTPAKSYARLLKIPLFFILMSLAAVVVNVTAEPVYGTAAHVGPLYFSVTAAGLQRGAKLAASAVGAVSCMYFLALSTPLTDLFYTLEKIKCPFLAIELMLLIYRFVFLLWSIAVELGRAADSRMGNVNVKTSIYTAGQISAALFIRALKRSSAVYDAMESRGYDGEIHVLPAFRMADDKREGEMGQDG